MAEFKGFNKLIKKKIRRRKVEEREKETGMPSWMEKLKGSDKDKALAVHRANQKRAAAKKRQKNSNIKMLK